MTDILYLENPRRRKRRRKMTAKQLKYFGKRRKRRARRNPRTALGHKIIKHRPHKRLNPRKGTSMRRKHHRRRFHRNPSFSVGGVIGTAKQGLKNAVTGAVGIAANKFISGQIASILKVAPANKQLVEIASAAVILPMIGKLTRFPGAVMAAQIAAAVAIFEAGKKFLPAAVQSRLAGIDEGDSYPQLPPSEASFVSGLGEIAMPQIENLF